jgi:hypothetical protein
MKNPDNPGSDNGANMKKAIVLLTLFSMVIFVQKEALAFEDNRLSLLVHISKDYLQIWAMGGYLPEMFYKECKEGNTINLCVLRKESEEYPGEIEMSVYSKSDSAYIDSNNDFITKLSDVSPGSIVSTLAKNSARKLACGQSSPGVEDICINGKPAISLRPRSVYDELAWALTLIRLRFIDSHDVDEITIAVDDDIATSTILRVQHEAKSAGFFKIIVVRDFHIHSWKSFLKDEKTSPP